MMWIKMYFIYSQYITGINVLQYKFPITRETIMQIKIK